MHPAPPHLDLPSPYPCLPVFPLPQKEAGDAYVSAADEEESSSSRTATARRALLGGEPALGALSTLGTLGKDKDAECDKWVNEGFKQASGCRAAACRLACLGASSLPGRPWS